MSLRSRLVVPFNTALRPIHMQLLPGEAGDPSTRDALSARRIIAAAAKAGLPIGDYLDSADATPHLSAQTVDLIIQSTDLPATGARVCEVGPGAGRFARHVLERLDPSWYEVYETARDWRAVLRQSYPDIVIREADGHSLGSTPDRSIDLAHAHRLFTRAEFSVTAGYLDEMARVVRPGGAIAFDIVTEACLDEATVMGWVQQGTSLRPVPRDWAIELMARRGLLLAASKLAPLPDGTIELLVFVRPRKTRERHPRSHAFGLGHL